MIRALKKAEKDKDGYRYLQQKYQRGNPKGFLEFSAYKKKLKRDNVSPERAEFLKGLFKAKMLLKPGRDPKQELRIFGVEKVSNKEIQKKNDAPTSEQPLPQVSEHEPTISNMKKSVEVDVGPTLTEDVKLGLQLFEKFKNVPKNSSAPELLKIMEEALKLVGCEYLPSSVVLPKEFLTISTVG